MSAGHRRHWCGHPLPSKIDQLVEDAKTQLNRAGIETDGNALTRS